LQKFEALGHDLDDSREQLQRVRPLETISLIKGKNPVWAQRGLADVLAKVFESWKKSCSGQFWTGFPPEDSFER
jgi:hypothetical protein